MLERPGVAKRLAMTLLHAQPSSSLRDHEASVWVERPQLHFHEGGPIKPDTDGKEPLLPRDRRRSLQ